MGRAAALGTQDFESQGGCRIMGREAALGT